jgi:hypothetical protein
VIRLEQARLRSRESFIGTIDSRHGTVAFQHGGLDDGHAPYTVGPSYPARGPRNSPG